MTDAKEKEKEDFLPTVIGNQVELLGKDRSVGRCDRNLLTFSSD
jgi:hypothetical protein